MLVGWLDGWGVGGARGLDLRLVVALGVGNGLLAVASVGEREGDVGNVPLIVCAFLYELDPHVWDGHCETVVEARTA